LPELCVAIDARITDRMELAQYEIAPEDGARLAWLYEHGQVLDRHDEERAIHLTVRLLPADRARFERR
jgi:GTP-binding protein HflX